MRRIKGNMTWPWIKTLTDSCEKRQSTPMEMIRPQEYPSKGCAQNFALKDLKLNDARDLVSILNSNR